MAGRCEEPQVEQEQGEYEQGRAGSSRVRYEQGGRWSKEQDAPVRGSRWLGEQDAPKGRRWYAPFRSYLEHRLYHAMRDEGIPLPKSEYKFGKWRFDFAWPDLKLAIEIHGGLSSTASGHRSLKGMLNDINKANCALSYGWRILVFTRYHLNTKTSLPVTLDVIRRAVSE